MIENGDKQAIAIYEEYNKAVMTAFPYFSDSDIDNVLAYIKEGPQEEEVVAVESTDLAQDSNQNGNLLFIVLALVLFNTILLIYVKNLLKDAAGVERLGMVSSVFLA